MASETENKGTNKTDTKPRAQGTSRWWPDGTEAEGMGVRGEGIKKYKFSAVNTAGGGWEVQHGG